MEIDEVKIVRAQLTQLYVDKTLWYLEMNVISQLKAA